MAVSLLPTPTRFVTSITEEVMDASSKQVRMKIMKSNFDVRSRVKEAGAVENGENAGATQAG